VQDDICSASTAAACSHLPAVCRGGPAALLLVTDVLLYSLADEDFLQPITADIHQPDSSRAAWRAHPAVEVQEREAVAQGGYHVFFLSKVLP
jgi:hypothetical protein